LEAQVEDSGTRILFTLSAMALLPTALKVLDNSSLERLVVGSVAGALPRAKSLLYRLFKRKEVSAWPNDPRISTFSQLIANDGRCAPTPIDAERDVALIQYTGGTTGAPKGAMLTHQNLSANARQVDMLDPEPEAEDRIMGVLPMFHVFANTCVLNRTVRRGGEIVMLPRFDAAQTLAAIQRTRVTSMPGVPTMYQALLDHADIAKTDFSSLRVCISGGASLPAEVKRTFEERTGAKLVEGYGLTETSGVVSTNPYQGLDKTGTIGQPLPATHVVLVDKEDPTRPPPPGEAGELTISGPQVMKGYWNRPDADSQVFIDGRLRTGDVGLIDEDGYLKIVDRLKDMISVSGFKVFPSQVEAVLYRHQAVKEALVIGISDRRAGERPKAYVTLTQGATASAEELMQWLNASLGKHERVVAVEIRAALPKTMIGKLSRKELQAEERAKGGA
jgi:long-chain acyl-CoA synthetase